MGGLRAKERISRELKRRKEDTIFFLSFFSELFFSFSVPAPTSWGKDLPHTHNSFEQHPPNTTPPKYNTPKYNA